jgi:rubrerythrin
MAKKYIDTDTAYEVLTEYYHQKTKVQHEALREALDRVPAADVVEVRHGRWEDTEFGWLCPLCKKAVCGYNKPNYCPSCGAKMDEGGDTE